MLRTQQIHTSKGLDVGFSERDELFFTTGSDNTDDQFFTSSEGFFNLSNHFFRGFISGEVKIFLGGTIFTHQSDVTIISDVEEGVFTSNNDGDLSSVTSGNGFFALLVGEDINTSDGGFSGTVLSSLGSGIGDDLAWVTL